MRLGGGAAAQGCPAPLCQLPRLAPACCVPHAGSRCAGTMPALRALIRAAGRSSEKHSPQAARILTAAEALRETVSRCFATPSITTPVWSLCIPHTFAAAEASSAACLGEHRGGNELDLPRFVSWQQRWRPGVARWSMRQETPGRRESSGGPLASPGSSSFPQPSGQPHFEPQPLGPLEGRSSLIKLLHAARVIDEAAQPGAVAYAASEAEGGSQLDTEETKSHAHQVGLRLSSGACSLPHPAKVEKGGEDAHFISSEAAAVGVADGVGGWADIGIDAGVYARELMARCSKAVVQELPGVIDPQKVLKQAHSTTTAQGSSTACIVVLREDRLQAANVGDSGFVVYRNGRVVFKSPPQQHDFNFPYQLGSQGCDPVEKAEAYTVQVAAGDVVVLGTDGLFDNLFDSEISSVVMHSTKAGWGPKDTAERIGALARLRAQDVLRQSPFARAAQEAGYRFTGGKEDDITVVVSYVVSSEGNAKAKL